MTYNLADLFESVVDVVPDREAIAAAERRLTYAQLDERANRLAHHLAAHGVGVGDHVGLMLGNGTEYLEGMLAAYVGEAARDLGRLRHFLVVADGSGSGTGLESGCDYEAGLAAASPKREFGPRSSDDLYIVYTGGTTGLPKGVVWRHEDIFFAAMGGGDPVQMGHVIHAPDELPSRVLAQPIVALPAAPFMHAAAQWLAFHELFAGGKLVLTPGGVFEPGAIWDLIERERVNLLVIVGDAMAVPLMDAFAARRERSDVSSLVAIASGGALFSPSIKERIAALLPGKLLIDGLGASETGRLGRMSSAQSKQFSVNDETAVLDDALRLASFKVPRDLVCVDEVLRSPAGKADYRWAREVARRALAAPEA